MNAIKLPVKATSHFSGQYGWRVKLVNGDFLSGALTEAEAHQIAMALNLHDELVEALMPFAAVDPTSVGSIPNEYAFLWKPSQTGKDLPGISIAHIKQAKAVLAKIESVNETKTTNP